MPVGPITRIQLCGKFAVLAGPDRVDSLLPGRRGLILLASLAAHRGQPSSRDQLIEAVWADNAPAAPATLTVLLSKTRALLGHEVIRGRSNVSISLPAETLIDTEIALVCLHQA